MFRDDVAGSPRTRKKGNGERRGGVTKRENFLEIPRHMLNGTFRLVLQRNIRHLSSPFRPIRPLPLSCSRGKIQIYAPTAPGVFFELMKNESARAVLSLSSLPSSHPCFARSSDFPNPPYVVPLPATALGVYCWSCPKS